MTFLDDKINFPELVKKAQFGCQESMNSLAQHAQRRLFAYIYRLTLNYDATEDLRQETLLQMVKSLKTLRRPERFWAWLYRTALGKVQHYFRTRQYEKVALPMSTLDKERLLQRVSGSYGDGLKNLINEELSKAIVDAMAKLKLKHCNILVLRCLEQMPYCEIADIMNCSELAAQVLFFRAKHSLKGKLSKDGFGKGMLLGALGLFGKMTAPADAAPVTTSAASTKVCFTAAVIGASGTKLGLAVATMVTAAAFTISLIASQNIVDGGYKLPKRSDVKSFYYIEQIWEKTANFGSNLTRGCSLSKGAYEQWYYFPEGIDGPMFMMMQRWDPQHKNKLCGWLQNACGNYYYQAGRNEICILNHRLRLSPLSAPRTRRLPTDTPEFVEFLDQMEGKIPGVNYTRDPQTGILVGALDNRFYEIKNFQTTIKYNSLDKTSFDSFRYPWPEDALTVDKRDLMHKRGWTYFRVSGEINGEQVQGSGQIPLVYGTIAEHWPWLKLNIGKKMKIVDSPSGAHLIVPDGRVIASYPAGSFFKGLARPWMGMHTIDLIRRDAAEKRIKFSTTKINPNANRSSYKDPLVTLFNQTGNTRTRITYAINIGKDVIERIEFSTDDSVENNDLGVLRFTYLQEMEDLADEFTAPEKINAKKTISQDSMGVLWLIKLAQGTLGQ